jgi:hypothetical protein
VSRPPQTPLRVCARVGGDAGARRQDAGQEYPSLPLPVLDGDKLISAINSMRAESARLVRAAAPPRRRERVRAAPEAGGQVTGTDFLVWFGPREMSMQKRSAGSDPGQLPPMSPGKLGMLLTRKASKVPARASSAPAQGPRERRERCRRPGRGGPVHALSSGRAQAGGGSLPPVLMI